MNNALEYLQKINKNYNQGIWDGMAGKCKPRAKWGKIRKIYMDGNKQGLGLKILTDYKK